MISKFKGKYYFLSNFFVKKIIIHGKEYNSTEHAYQAYKAQNIQDHELVRLQSSPRMSKKIGQQINVRTDWEEFKYKHMYKIVKKKFEDSKLKQMLLQTGNKYLEEGNVWHDNIWGDCKCDKCKNIKGKNWLGKILMKIREEIND